MLFSVGAKTYRAVAEDGVGTVVVHADPTADVRELTQTVARQYPHTEFVSKRRVHRPVETVAGFRSEISEQLTDKQERALETAYYGGYFEWPSRESTAAELAEAVGITPQTYHQHLRVAERKVFASLFRDTDDT